MQPLELVHAGGLLHRNFPAGAVCERHDSAEKSCFESPGVRGEAPPDPTAADAELAQWQGELFVEEAGAPRKATIDMEGQGAPNRDTVAGEARARSVVSSTTRMPRGMPSRAPFAK